MSSPIDHRQLGEELHARLLAGTSATVTSEIAERFLPLVASSLRKRFHNLSDQHLVDMAVEDALIDYFDNPARFDPRRAGLATYLYWRARSLLLNLMAGQKKSFGREKAVELEDEEFVYLMTESETADIEQSLVQREMDETTWRKLCEIFTDRRDLELVKLMMEGVRETARYAEVLDASSLTANEQASLVKRHKDRLKIAIQRKYRREET
jgi:DNA-directed RNA polymerase specialized sigma24 family protein